MAVTVMHVPAWGEIEAEGAAYRLDGPGLPGVPTHLVVIRLAPGSSATEPGSEIERIVKTRLPDEFVRTLTRSTDAERLTALLAAHRTGPYAGNPTTPPRSREILSATALDSVIAFIEEHLAEDLSLRTLAATTHFSPYHFARLFRKALGISPHQYVLRRRVERAKLLLAETDWSVSAIAFEVGFAGGSHLGLHFKRVTGMSPSQFR
jgi:AraC-like DNA-binding protein